MKLTIILTSILLLLTSCGNTENNSQKINNSANLNNNIESKVEKGIANGNTGITEVSVDNINILTNDGDEYIVEPSDFVNGNEIIKDIVKMGDLTKDENNGLILMREEEKLAYDVYITMYEKWGQKIFLNISKSEKTHMDAVKDLLISYNLDDPIKDNTIGVFTSEKLQKLYNDLVAKGNLSIVDALVVGITIEDLDIYDLDELSLKTDKLDILAVYNNLNRGSRNHMRAFNKNLVRNGGSYDIQFITNDKYTQIIAGEQEKGN